MPEVKNQKHKEMLDKALERIEGHMAFPITCMAGFSFADHNRQRQIAAMSRQIAFQIIREQKEPQCQK